jgi:enamine deaminase RidA (YjgF/YER057c/UK114 family)
MGARPVACRVEGSEWYDALPASPAVRAGDLVFVSGQIDADAGGAVRSPGDVVAQADGAVESMQRALAACGGGLEDVVDLISFHRDVRDVDAVMEVARDRLGPDYPAWTPVGMSGSYHPDVLVVIRAIAHLGGGRKRCFTPPESAWMSRHPMSAACARGDLVFVSGQSGLRADGEPAAPGDHAEGSKLAYARARECLAAAGGSMDDVIDICSFHLDPRGMVPSERAHMEAWEGTAPGAAASWTAIGVPALFRPGMLSQYRFIADLGEGPRIGRVSASIHWKDTPNAGASRKAGGRLIAIAGEVASDAEGNVTTPGDTFSQARYCFNRIREVVEMHGGSMDDVVEITSFHKDHRDWEPVMRAGREYFDEANPPAWTPVGAVGLWNPGYQHEIYALAVVGA